VQAYYTEFDQNRASSLGAVACVHGNDVQDETITCFSNVFKRDYKSETFRNTSNIARTRSINTITFRLPEFLAEVQTEENELFENLALFVGPTGGLIRESWRTRRRRNLTHVHTLTSFIHRLLTVKQVTAPRNHRDINRLYTTAPIQLLPYLLNLTSWRRVLLEKLTVAHLVKKLSTPLLTES
jgi:hypothetical protein